MSWDSPEAHTVALAVNRAGLGSCSKSQERGSHTWNMKYFGPGLVTGEGEEEHLAHLKIRPLPGFRQGRKK